MKTVTCQTLRKVELSQTRLDPEGLYEKLERAQLVEVKMKNIVI